jgi:hypothetical protein
MASSDLAPDDGHFFTELCAAGTPNTPALLSTPLKTHVLQPSSTVWCAITSSFRLKTETVSNCMSHPRSVAAIPNLSNLQSRRLFWAHTAKASEPALRLRLELPLVCLRSRACITFTPAPCPTSSTHFPFRPSTREMVSYLCRHVRVRDHYENKRT